MRLNFLCASVLAFFVAASLHAEVRISISPFKAEIVRGEPVWALVTVRNSSKVPVQVPSERSMRWSLQALATPRSAKEPLRPAAIPDESNLTSLVPGSERTTLICLFEPMAIDGAGVVDIHLALEEAWWPDEVRKSLVLPDHPLRTLVREPTGLEVEAFHDLKSGTKPNQFALRHGGRTIYSAWGAFADFLGDFEYPKSLPAAPAEIVRCVASDGKECPASLPPLLGCFRAFKAEGVGIKEEIRIRDEEPYRSLALCLAEDAIRDRKSGIERARWPLERALTSSHPKVVARARQFLDAIKLEATDVHKHQD